MFVKKLREVRNFLKKLKEEIIGNHALNISTWSTTKVSTARWEYDKSGKYSVSRICSMFQSLVMGVTVCKNCNLCQNDHVSEWKWI